MTYVYPFPTHNFTNQEMSSDGASVQVRENATPATLVKRVAWLNNKPKGEIGLFDVRQFLEIIWH